MVERQKECFERWMNGETFTAIARDHRVTAVRIQQLARKYAKELARRDASQRTRPRAEQGAAEYEVRGGGMKLVGGDVPRWEGNAYTKQTGRTWTGTGVARDD